MDIIVTYNVHHEIPFGILIAQYFYLTGLSAGSFVISVLATMLGRLEYKPLGKIGAIAAPMLLIVAPINLIVELEQPLRFWHLFLYRNLGSAMTWGTFLLTLYPLECLIYAYFVFKGNMKWAKYMGMIGIPLAISVHGYTGFILAMGKARVLWNTPLMPILFLISAVVSGIALVIVVAAIRHWFFSKKVSAVMPAEETERELALANDGGGLAIHAIADSVEKRADKALLFSLAKIMAGFIILDLFLVFSDALVMLRHTEDAFAVVNLIRFGPTHFGFLFLGVEIFLGGILPVILIFLPRTSKSLPVLVAMSILVLMGVFAMRYVLVIGGQFVPMS